MNKYAGISTDLKSKTIIAYGQLKLFLFSELYCYQTLIKVSANIFESISADSVFLAIQSWHFSLFYTGWVSKFTKQNNKETKHIQKLIHLTNPIPQFYKNISTINNRYEYQKQWCIRIFIKQLVKNNILTNVPQKMTKQSLHRR